MGLSVYPSKAGIPSGVTAARPSSPAIGDTYYNGQTGQLEIFTAVGWQPCSAPPGTPYNLVLTDVGTGRAYGNGAINVTFDLPANGGLPTNCVAYTTAGGFSGSNATSPVTVSSLASNTSYSIYAIAQNGFGNSTNSVTAGPVTVTTVPQAPQSVTTSLPGLNTVQVSWTIGATGGKSLTGHTVTASPGGATQSVDAAATSATFTGLTAGTTYTFTVTATNANGTSLGATATAVPVNSINMEVLVVAGGGSGQGGGGWDAGSGGGAGGYRSFASYPVSGSFTVTVGAGGTSATFADGTKGSNSVFSGISASGGGAGTGGNRTLGTGGSGGAGRGSSNTGLGNAGGYSPVEGYDGGAGYQPDSWGGNYYGGGGGGASQTAQNNGRRGGDGLSSSITGSAVTRAGGGGGGGGWDVNGPEAGGAGGGGAGGRAYPGTAGTANTGSGGGGTGHTFSNQGAFPSGAGGSGIVICAYPSSYPEFSSIGAGLTYTMDTVSRAGYRVYRFTAGTGTVTL